MDIRKRILLLASFLLTMTAVGWAGELPLAVDPPLSSIVEAIENRETGLITSVELDDGLIEVEIGKENGDIKLYLDPNSGKEEYRKREYDYEARPPADGKPLSAILKSIEDQELGIITSAEFGRGVWEVNIRQQGSRLKLFIDPLTGERKR